MTEQNVRLTEQEWQQVISIIATAPWNVANPLLMKITQQLQRQQTNNVEMPINQGEMSVKQQH